MTTAGDPADLAAVLAQLLADRLPHRMVPDLARIRELLDLLGQPQRAYPSVHITGTNGKTSTARMIEGLLRAAGLRTGRYTSPHLVSPTERISLDGEPITEEQLVAVLAEIDPYVKLVDSHHDERVTFFELLTAAAFSAFADAPVEAAVVEVGLGGTWDATNVLDAPVAAVTAIDLDHTELLGSTVAEIATEKAGIITAGAIAVSDEQSPDAQQVLLRRAATVGAELWTNGREFAVTERRIAVGGQLLDLVTPGGRYPEVMVPLHGAHQARNAAVALAATEAFLGGGRRGLGLEVVREGFAAVTSPGRLEVVATSPTVLLDAAHNPAGARALARALGESFRFPALVAVLAVLGDKDVDGILAALLPVVDAVVATENGSPRALSAATLATAVRRHPAGRHLDVTEAPDFAAAVRGAVEDARGRSAGVLVTGSVVTVGQARQLFAPGRYDHNHE